MAVPDLHNPDDQSKLEESKFSHLDKAHSDSVMLESKTSDDDMEVKVNVESQSLLIDEEAAAILPPQVKRHPSALIFWITINVCSTVAIVSLARIFI